MEAIKKPERYPSIQWTGANKTECDRLVNERSTRRGNTLTYLSVVGFHQVNLNDWLIKYPDDVAHTCSEQEFNDEWTIAP